MSKSRKVIQIAILPEASNKPEAIIALADDGTMWLSELNLYRASWEQIKPIPGADT